MNTQTPGAIRRQRAAEASAAAFEQPVQDAKPAFPSSRIYTDKCRESLAALAEAEECLKTAEMLGEGAPASALTKRADELIAKVVSENWNLLSAFHHSKGNVRDQKNFNTSFIPALKVLLTGMIDVHAAYSTALLTTEENTREISPEAGF